MEKIKNLNLLIEKKEYNQEYVYITYENNILTFKEYINLKKYEYILKVVKKDDYFYIDFNNTKYIKLLNNLLDRLYIFSLIDNKEDMLIFCNKEGKYIDSKYYDLKNIEDCVNYIMDCEDNYCDEFMYQHPRNTIDYYDEDHYIDYHFKNAGYNMFDKEYFWLKLKEIKFNVDNLIHSDFLKYEDLLEILFTFKEQETSEYLGNFLIQTNEDDWDFGIVDIYEEKDRQDEEIELFIKSRLKEKLDKKLPMKDKNERKIKI